MTAILHEVLGITFFSLRHTFFSIFFLDFFVPIVFGLLSPLYFPFLFGPLSPFYFPFLFGLLSPFYSFFYFDFFFKFCSFLCYSAENPNWHTESDGRWFTSRVISRIKSNLVQTKGGPYCLEGKMNFQLAFSYGTPQFILSAFKSGFPENWDMYREQWRKFTKHQRGMNFFFHQLLAVSIKTPQKTAASDRIFRTVF